MASEVASNVNGVYDSQYSQPAELAASTPSHPPSSSQQAATGQPTTQQQQKADPQEIGWYFVEQYYTTLSKTPERIHLFYTKKSQLVIGVEAEKVVPAAGSKAISEKIRELDIQDCKVRILNVDSQSSFDNIVVQVIGELSNKSQPHHKFVQTFVLATQPNGYFVLNDIFRYLSDEEDEVSDDQIPEHAIGATSEAAEAPVEIPAADELVNTEDAASVVDTKLEVIDDSKTEPTNGLQSAGAETKRPEKADLPAEEADLLPGSERPLEPEHTPVADSTPQVTQEQSAALPQAKKTWANMVGRRAPAIPALPTAAPASGAQTKAVSKLPAQSNSTGVKSVEATPTAPVSRVDEWQTADHGKKSKAPQTKPTEGIVYAYLKNITDKVDARELRQVLEKYGEVKYFDVSRQRNCAFVEFADPTGYAAAVAANPHEVNGETINVEERRPRPGTYNTNNNLGRGGSNVGRGRGAFQGRGGSQGNVQREKPATFQPRGAKSGNVTPKGRGQSQAA